VRVKSPRWTTERFKLASQAGCFHDMKVELVAGRLVEMTESPEHRNTVENLVELFATVFDKAHWYVARESSVEFDDWTPLPDIAVCRGPRRPTYSHRAPTSGTSSFSSKSPSQPIDSIGESSFRGTAGPAFPWSGSSTSRAGSSRSSRTLEARATHPAECSRKESWWG